MKRHALTLAIALTALPFTVVHADDARERELATARAELARAAGRVAELSAGEGRLAAMVAPRPVIGVVLTADARAGARIGAVTPGGGAAKAGLRAGDRIVSVGGKPIVGTSGDLRVENARRLLAGGTTAAPVVLGYERDGRRAEARVTPQPNRQLFVKTATGLASLDGALGELGSAGALGTLDTAQLSALVERATSELTRASGDSTRAAADAQTIRALVVQRAGSDAACTSAPCLSTRVLSALRWNGLNLATLDAQLGRYFGTTRGTLVLSSGGIDGLQSGDVIQKVDGQAVDSPAALMAALRDRPDDARVPVDLLRERRVVRTQVTLPGRLHGLPPEPPMPPAPPAPPAVPAPPGPKSAALDLPVPVVVVAGVPTLAMSVPVAPSPPAPPAPPAPPRID